MQQENLLVNEVMSLELSLTEKEDVVGLMVFLLNNQQLFQELQGSL